jgi:hypothetical protein
MSGQATEAANPPLNKLNWLNLLSYVLNFAITYGVGTLGWLGNGNNAELSEKYQTLVTPKSSAFSIWAIIFLMQAVFCILQLFPRFRAKELVQKGVGYYYIVTCISQVCWTLAFAYEIIWLSLVFMLLIWASLLGLLYSQYYVKSEGTLLEFWLLRFPFAIHCGWLTAASALNVNVLVVKQDASAAIQLAVGIVSLAVLHAISVWVLFGIRRANYTIAGVLSWANGWIYAELQSPKDSIVERFSEDAVSGVSYAAVAVAFIIVAQITIRVVNDLIKSRNTEERIIDGVDTTTLTSPEILTPQKPSSGDVTEVLDNTI